MSPCHFPHRQQKIRAAGNLSTQTIRASYQEGDHSNPAILLGFEPARKIPGSELSPCFIQSHKSASLRHMSQQFLALGFHQFSSAKLPFLGKVSRFNYFTGTHVANSFQIVRHERPDGCAFGFPNPDELYLHRRRCFLSPQSRVLALPGFPGFWGTRLSCPFLDKLAWVQFLAVSP